MQSEFPVHAVLAARDYVDGLMYHADAGSQYTSVRSSPRVAHFEVDPGNGVWRVRLPQRHFRELQPWPSTGGCNAFEFRNPVDQRRRMGLRPPTSADISRDTNLPGHVSRAPMGSPS